MFLLVYLVESRVLAVPKDRRAELVDDVVVAHLHAHRLGEHRGLGADVAVADDAELQRADVATTTHGEAVEAAYDVLGDRLCVTAGGIGDFMYDLKAFRQFLRQYVLRIRQYLKGQG